MNAALITASALLLLIACGCLWVSADGQRRAPLHLLALGHLTGAAVLAAGTTWSLVLFDRVAAWLPVASVLLLGVAGWARAHAVKYGGKEVAGSGGRDVAEYGGREVVENRGSDTSTPPHSHPSTPPTPNTQHPIPNTQYPHWFDIALAVLVVAGLAIAASRVWLLPLDWDGWAIWQLKARALAAGELKALLTDPRYNYSHVEYPLLVPSHTAWLCGGEFRERTAQIGGLVFLLDLLALFYYEARERTERTWALAGTAAMLSWALVPKHTASGFADIPMAAYALGAVCLLPAGSPLTFAPLLLGAMLTKNEGLFTLGACLAIAVLGLASHPAEDAPKSGRDWRRALASVGVPTALGLVPWSLVKRRWSLPTEFLDPNSWPALTPGEVVSRLGVVAQGFVRQFVSFGPWYPGWGLTWFVIAAGLVLSVRRRLRETAPFWILVAAHFAGATAAYLLTKTNPALHLDRSLDRLILHVAPAALLAAMMAFRDAGETV